uniref:Uncharacterized protein n=1 Tax=Manihot esculenta TaxID=3983 RepID=A0A2C9VJY8_MANES
MASCLLGASPSVSCNCHWNKMVSSNVNFAKICNGICLPMHEYFCLVTFLFLLSVCKPTTKIWEALCICDIVIQSSFPYDVS